MEKITGSPVVTEMLVIPVAGRDQMLLNIGGAHAPFFTRNLVILKDNTGHTGVGEVHGGEAITAVLEACRAQVIGKQIGDYREILKHIRRKGDPSEGLQNYNLKNLQFVVHAETAVECALLDLLGQFLGLPLCHLLGDGQQRKEVTVLGYLFYVADSSCTPLPYENAPEQPNAWFRQRQLPAMDTAAIVEQALAAQERYGFRDFKLKGGVLAGEQEVETVQALKKQFPDGRINIDPNGAWSLQDAIRLCLQMKQDLSYVEDPCGPEAGYSSREIMSEFRMATGIPVATNMIATNWRQLHHAVVGRAVDIVLADPHFWTMNGSVRVSQLLDEWGMTWGCHSNNHFDISLAIFAQTAAACSGQITAMDTHWIWQDGQNLTRDGMQIQNGRITIPDRPGLGVQVDMQAVLAANQLYNRLDTHERDDAAGMQFLIPGWKFDSRRPCMVR